MLLDRCLSLKIEHSLICCSRRDKDPPLLLPAKNRTSPSTSSITSASPSSSLPPPHLTSTSTIVDSVSSTTTNSGTTTDPTSTLCASPVVALADRLVIGSRESSPPPATCCYYSVPTKIAQPLRQSSSAPPATLTKNTTALAADPHRKRSSSFEIRVTPPVIHSRSLQSPTSLSFHSQSPPGEGPVVPPLIVHSNYGHRHYSSSVVRRSQASNASLLSSSQSNFDDRPVDSVSSGKCSPTFNNSTDWICDESVRSRNLNGASSGRDHHNRRQNHQHKQHSNNVQRLCANLSLVKCATHRCCPSIDSSDLNATSISSSTSDSGSECSPYQSTTAPGSRYVNGIEAATASVSGKRIVASFVGSDRLVQPDRGGGDPSNNIGGESHTLSVQLTKNCVGFAVGGGNGSDDCFDEANANQKHDTKITQTPYDKLEDGTSTDIKNKSRTKATASTKSRTSSASSTVRSAVNVIHDGAKHDALDFDDEHNDVVSAEHSDHDASLASVGIIVSGDDDDAFFTDPANYDDLSFIDSSSTYSEVYQTNHQLSAASTERHTNSSGIPPFAHSAYFDSSPKINSVTLKSCFKNINNNIHEFKPIASGSGEAANTNRTSTINTNHRSSDFLPFIQLGRTLECSTKTRHNLDAVAEEPPQFIDRFDSPVDTDFNYEVSCFFINNYFINVIFIKHIFSLTQWINDARLSTDGNV